MEGVRGSIPLPPTINANEIKYLTIAKVSGAVVRNRDGVRGAQSRRQPRPSACPRAVDHRERLWDRARKIAPHHLRFFSQNPKAILRH